MRYLKIIIGILKTYPSRPTGYFVLLFVMIVGLFMLAYMYNHNIVYVMMFSAFSLAMGSSFIGRRNLYRVEVVYCPSQRLFAKRTQPLVFELKNLMPFSRFALQLRMGEARSKPQSIDAEATAFITLETSGLKRGMHSIEDLELFSYFPFGHERFYTKRKATERVMVLPAPEGEKLKERFFLQKSFSGIRKAFDQLRPFVQGDSITLIDWKRMAKGEMLSKAYEYEQPNPHLYFDEEQLEGTREVRLSQLCLWVLEAEQVGFEFTLKVSGKVYESSGGMDAIFKALACA